MLNTIMVKLTRIVFPLGAEESVRGKSGGDRNFYNLIGILSQEKCICQNSANYIFKVCAIYYMFLIKDFS